MGSQQHMSFLVSRFSICEITKMFCVYLSPGWCCDSSETSESSWRPGGGRWAMARQCGGVEDDQADNSTE